MVKELMTNGNEYTGEWENGNRREYENRRNYGETIKFKKILFSTFYLINIE